jgi:hypothetical protein
VHGGSEVGGGLSEVQAPQGGLSEGAFATMGHGSSVFAFVKVKLMKSGGFYGFFQGAVGGFAHSSGVLY